MKLKICGLNPIRDVQLCINLNVEYLGFVFYEKSPRNINFIELDNLKKYNKKDSSFVAVSVNPSNDFIKKKIIGNFDYIQLHGDENKNRVYEIKNLGIKIIKAIKIKEKKDIASYKNFVDIADLILFDSTSMEKSQSVPENLLSELPKGDKFGLAGAINSENILRYCQLGFNFLDLSSGLERENLKGYKDHLKIKNLINKINEPKN
tara:strand:+ start:4631 stop:5248 length:618 start_codon:yes stop_codon:yes gene_type:complete